MHTRAIVLATLIFLPLFILPATAAVPPEFAGRGCAVWDRENGSDDAVRLNVLRTDDGGKNYNLIAPSIAPRRDNTISAIQCDHHCSAALYDQPQRQGGEIFTIDGQSGFVSLDGHWANNLTSSFSVYCAR